MKLIKYLVMIVLIVGLASCGKDGSMGPAGDKGDAGAQGSAGMDGKTVLNGTSDPKKDEGKSGDFYLNTNSYVLFGPKTASDWGTGKSILGAKGDKGEKGDKGNTGAKGDKGDKGETAYAILSGSTDPSNAQGKLGDFYYNTANKTLFYRAGVGRISTWKRIAQLSNTIQFSMTVKLPDPGFITLVDIDLPFDVLEKSVVNAYIQPYTQFTHWYPLPGPISTSGTGDEFIIYYTDSNNKTNVRIQRQSGTRSFPNDIKLRILVTQAEVFKTMSTKVDFKNYMDVKDYFNLGN